MNKINRTDLSNILKKPVRKIIVTDTLSKTRHISLTLSKIFKKTANTKVLSIDKLPEYLASPLLFKKGLEIPDIQELSSLLYETAEEIFDEKSYFSNYMEQPGVFKKLADVAGEIMAAGVKQETFKKLDNKKKWEDITKFIEKLETKYSKNNYASPAVVYKEAITRAADGAEEIFLFEINKELPQPLEELINKIVKNYKTYSMELLPEGYEKIKNVTGYLEKGTAPEGGIKSDIIELRSFSQPEEEIRNALNKLVSRGRAGDCALALADYGSNALKVKTASERAGIKVRFGEGLPLHSFKSVRLFITFLRLFRNPLDCQPLMDIVTSSQLEKNGKEINRTYLRKVTAEHKKNRTPGDFGRYLENKEEEEDCKRENLDFLAGICKELSEIFDVLEKHSDSGKLKKEPFLKIIDRFIVSGKDKPAVYSLKELLEKVTKDMFFINDPEQLSDKLIEKIMESFTAGADSDGQSLYVTSVAAIAGSCFKNVACTGMDGRSFVPGVPIDPVFLYTEREQINSIAGKKAFKDVELHTKESRTGFFDLFKIASRKMLFSWSSNEEITGKSVMPSPYLFELYRVLSGTPGDIETIEEYAGLERRVSKPFSLSVEGCLAEGKNPESVLLKLTPHLKNFRKVFEDKKSNDISEFTGIARGEKYKEYIIKKPFSPSGITDIIECPYRFFLNRVLYIEGEDLSERDVFDWLDHLQWGTLVHKTLCNFYGTHSENLPGSPDPLVEAGEEELKKVKEENPPPSDIIYEATKHRLKKELKYFFSHGLVFKQGFKPSNFEIAVGMKADRESDRELSEETPVKMSFRDYEILLRGKIDRADKDGEGNYILIDYKTGKDKTDDKDIIKRKRYVQHIIYPYIFQKAFRKKFKINSIKAGYYFCTSRGEFARRKFALDPKEEKFRFEETFVPILKQVLEGNFPLNKDSCEYCDFNEVCPEKAVDSKSGVTLNYRNAVKKEEDE